MLKRLSAFFVLFTAIILTASAENVFFTDHNGSDYFFYIPGEEEINDYFNMMFYLMAVDSGEEVMKDGYLENFFEYHYGKETLHSLLFESFLMRVSNPDLQSDIIDYFDKTGLEDDLSKAVRMKYAAEVHTITTEDGTNLQYGFEDHFYDENINLFSMNEVGVFEGRLGLMLFDNDWGVITYNSPDADKNEQSFFCMCGGGTNTVTIHFEEFRGISGDDFIKKAMGVSHYEEKYPNWSERDVPVTGILKRSGADEIWITYGSGPDMVEEIDSAAFEIHLYSRKLKAGYTVSYFMNISTINMSYPMRGRLWNRLLMQLPFVFIAGE